MKQLCGWLLAGFVMVAGCGKEEASNPFGDLAGVQAAAEKGDSNAQFVLGDYYFQGKGGLPVDYEKAVKWLRSAAEKGNAEAQVRLGVCYSDGKGVPPDSAEEVKWYRLSADQGHPRAQANLAACYLVGKGVPQDEVESYKWYTLALKGGAAGAEMMRKTVSVTPDQQAEAERKAKEFKPNQNSGRSS